MTYEEAMIELDGTWTSKATYNLDRIRLLMERLGNPQDELAFIHVAGTNGKGSVVTYTSSILACAGLRVGVYTSPYMVRFNDRIRVLEGREAVYGMALDQSTGEIGDDDLVRLYAQVRATAMTIREEDGPEPTTFDIITAISLLYFREQACDVVVFEVGLGGLLDSTNVIPAPRVAVITALGYDHLERLGRTMREIATQKAGIIKAGTGTVLLYSPEAASMTAGDAFAIRDVVTEACDRVNVPLRIVDQDEPEQLASSWQEQQFSLYGYDQPLTIHLAGKFQMLNAALAVRAVEAWDRELARSSAVYEGLEHARWPGRLELMSEDPVTVLDGAHNPQAARRLRETLEQQAAGRRIVMLVGVVADKDSYHMLADVLFSPAYRISGIVTTEPSNPRRLPAAELAERVEQTYRKERERHAGLEIRKPVVVSLENRTEALETAQKLAGEQGAILVCWGSLYLVSDLRALLIEGRKSS